MNDLDVFSQMAKENKDIRLSTNLISVNKVKQGGIVEMGIDPKTMMDIALEQEKYYVLLYVVNKEQFNEIKNL